MPRHSSQQRVRALDFVRGLTVISMVAFHACYDVVYLYGIPLDFFSNESIQTFWRASISWSFLFLAGWITIHSRSNAKRAALYGAAALAVYLATTVASVDTPISFGILYCMAASTVLFIVVQPMFRKSPWIFALLSFALFLGSRAVPETLYEFPGLEWLGFPSQGFSSGDYYPNIPYSFLYLTGAAAGMGWKSSKDSDSTLYPAWMYTFGCKPIDWIGRHSLVIYLAHQPLLILLFTLAVP